MSTANTFCGMKAAFKNVYPTETKKKPSFGKLKKLLDGK